MAGMGSHQSAAARTTTWLTPLEVVRSLGRFDLDPCGYPGWATAEHLICLPDDGLAAQWAGRVWLNPPYGRQTWEWLAKLAAHGQGTALVFARSETEGARHRPCPCEPNTVRSVRATTRRSREMP